MESRRRTRRRRRWREAGGEGGSLGEQEEEEERRSKKEEEEKDLTWRSCYHVATSLAAGSVIEVALLGLDACTPRRSITKLTTCHIYTRIIIITRTVGSCVVQASLTGP